MNNPITFCIGSSNNLEYLKLAIHSVRTYSHFKDARFIIHAENCTDGTNAWLVGQGKDKYCVEPHIEFNDEEDRVRGIGGGMNFCASHVETEYIMLLHADMFASQDWDINALKIFEKYPGDKLWVSSHRIQPNVFNENSRPGTLVVPKDFFGEFAKNFDEASFIEYAKEFSELNDIEIRKGEGVSGLIRKRDWDEIGGNDPRFNPLSFDDMDLFIRMQNAGFKFVLTSKSIVYHFGSRSANGHFADDNIKERSKRQINYEQRNLQRFMEKWGQAPQWDEVGFVKPIKI
jgi:GT2 family glycosyltransferase